MGVSCCDSQQSKQSHQPFGLLDSNRYWPLWPEAVDAVLDDADDGFVGALTYAPITPPAMQMLPFQLPQADQ